MEIIQSLVISFLLTIFLEGIIFFIFGFKKKKYYLLFFFVNLLTNPCVVFISLTGVRFLHGFGIRQQLFLEVIVVLVEGWVYNRFSKKEDYLIKDPYILSLVANTFSYGSVLIGLKILFG